MKYREECQEIEIKDGKGSASYPIYDVLNVTWQHESLNSIVWNQDEEEFTVSGDGSYSGHSMIKLHYKVRYIEYEVRYNVPNPQTNQFLILMNGVATGNAVRVRCYRYNGDVQRADIFSPYSSDVNAAMQLGRVEIDLGENWAPVSQDIVFSADALVGDVNVNYDRLDGPAAWRGVVTGVQHGLDGDAVLTTRLSMLRGR